MNLKVPSVGLLITNSVVLVILADLFKHKMNCQHSSDLKLDPPLRLWSDIQNAATKIRLCRPHHQLLIPASKPAQPQLWLCSKLALFAFGKGEQWVFFS